MTYKEKRMEHILQSAHTLFSHKGFDQTTMQDVAREAGLGVATIFRYFPKKDKLIIAVIVTILDDLLPQYEAILHTNGTCYEKLEMVFNHYIKASESETLQNMKLLEAFESYAAFVKEPLEDIDSYHRAYANITNILGEIIKEGKSDQSIRSDLASEETLGAVLNAFGLFTRKLSFFESVQMGNLVILPKEQAVIIKNIFLDYLKPIRATQD